MYWIDSRPDFDKGVEMLKGPERQQPDRRPQSLKERLREDFVLAVVASFSALAGLAIGGFAVYRLLTGHLAGAVLNSSILLLILSILAYALKSGHSRRAALVFAIVATAACIISAAVLGRTGFLWAYAVLWLNYLLTGRRLALGLNLSLIVAMLALAHLFSNMLEQVTFIVTALLISGYGYISSQRSEAQQIELERLASTDPLTGAGNRRLMRQRLERAVRGFDRRGEPATVMVLDLDHFKQINDRFGHEAGDEVLAEFADQVRAGIRAGDGFFRMGGEEFVILLPGMDSQAARETLPALHRRLSECTRGPESMVHISAGAAVLKPGEGWSRWLARADSALYEAKRAGRDRLIFATQNGREGGQERGAADE